MKIATVLGLSAVTLSASGYKIPEQSLNGTALSAAYVANASGADASYYNPANMVWMTGGAEIEAAFTYINLTSINYTDIAQPLYNSKSKVEKFYVPTFHYVSPAVNDWRFGLSVVAPGGLSKRWDGAYQMLKAEEFTLKVIEVNPTASYKVNDKFAVGFGLRGVYSDGTIKLRGGAPFSPVTYEHTMEADSIDFGYNLAMSYKPMNNLTFSTTYRSKVDLTVAGDITGSSTLRGAVYPNSVKTQVPLPAALALAAAYTMNNTTVELVYERTYWSVYDKLDFDFTNASLEAVFGVITPKNWKDVNAYRIGITHQYSDALKLMAGFAIDKNPAPDATLGFELPDSDAKLYSAGFEYKINDTTKVGLAYLYDEKESRSVLGGAGKPNGTFTDTSAHLVTMSLKYKF
jgi:long-chain fatty acid transport protein